MKNILAKGDCVGELAPLLWLLIEGENFANAAGSYRIHTDKNNGCTIRAMPAAIGSNKTATGVSRLIRVAGGGRAL